MLEKLRKTLLELPPQVDALRQHHLPQTEAIVLSYAPCGRSLSLSWSSNDAGVRFPFKRWANAGLDIVLPLTDSRMSLAQEIGCPWLELTIPSHGVAWVDFDHYPQTDMAPWTELHATALAAELTLVPRANSSMVPAWMKVRLAVEGYWDIEQGCPAWTDNLDPTARPVPQAEAEAAYADATPVSHILFGPNGAPDGLRRPDR